MAMVFLNMEAYESESTLTKHMEQELMNIRKGESSNQYKPPTIHKVPNRLKHGCPDDYEPQLISIGPLHRHKPELRKMDRLKWTYLQELIQRSNEINRLEEYDNANCMAEFVKAMWEQEQDVRKQYSVDIGMEAGKLVEVLVLDGCFLVELFIKRATGPMGPPWGDARWNLPMLRQDLLLLENQIPFSVLIALFKIALPGGLPPVAQGETTPPPPLGILDLALRYIVKGKAGVEDLKKQPEQIHHLLHLNHICQLLHSDTDPMQSPASNISLSTSKKLLRGSKKIIWGSLVTFSFFIVSLVLMCKRPRHHSSKRGEARTPRAIPSATNLKEVGIKFKKKYDKENVCCLNVSFDEEKGKLKIPFLSIQQSTVSFFSNLIAFEQCSEDIETHFTAYATFMDNIIDTSEDVEILVRDGIIESKLGTNEDVASLFNNIGKGSTLNYDKHYLADLFKRVNAYCDSDRHRWRAALVNSYFHNPWAVASVLVAVALLLLTLGATIATIWQTIYTVKSYEKQVH